MCTTHRRHICTHPLIVIPPFLFFFFFNDTATTEIYTLSLHDALPIAVLVLDRRPRPASRPVELDDHARLVLQLDLVHAILERAQRQAATGRAQTSGLDRLQHAIGRETEKRLPGLSGHPCDRISSLRDACVRVRAPAASESPGW